MTTVAVVDDHIVLRNGLCKLLEGFGEYEVLFEADHGMEFIDKLNPAQPPEIVLLDINMPRMDGFQTAHWIKNNYPQIRVLALSMYDNENAIIRIFRGGARGYLLKDCGASELRAALHAVATTGYYQSELVSSRLIHTVNHMDDEGLISNILTRMNSRELEFLKLVCSELTYKEIADKMGLSPRTIDGYRDQLFEKLGVKTRVGLVLYAIRTGIVTV